MGIEPSTIHVSAASLDEVREIYERGQYLSAYRKAEAIAPLHCWRGAAARILASRLAGNLGNGRLGDWSVIHAYREEPANAESLWYFGNYLCNTRGPLRAWQFVKSHDMPADASDELRSHWYSQKGRILGLLRDFDEADAWLDRAEAINGHAWNAMERALVLTVEDKHDEAEATVRKALDARPWYRPAVQWLAHFLVQRERDDDALAFLREACGRLESGAIWLQMHNLLRELGRYDEAMDALDQYERLSPLLDDRAGEFLAARRSDLAYWRGDWDTARTQIRTAIDCGARWSTKLRVRQPGFNEHFAKALDGPKPEKPWIELPVPFVRQHHETCVPATLTSLFRYWGKEADHLEAAEKITYRGTTHVRERRWAEENGFVTKEFTVTWEAAKSLLDRGIPFTLTTPETTSSHLQAVVGYDEVRHSFWIRDPGERHRREFFADAFFERYSSTGPRGMALVPAERGDELRSLDLPDAPLHDRLNAIETALETHRREEADAAVRALEAEHPEHLIAWTGRWMLEAYDADSVGLLAAVEKILSRYPEDMRQQLNKATLLRELGRRDDRLEQLRRLADSDKPDPACWLQYAQQLSEDAREHVRAKLYLKKAIRFNPGYAANLSAMSRILWSERRFEEAWELDRFAVCMENKDENLARSYFQNARVLRKEQEAIDMLRRRFERFGAKAMLPARTLYFALVELERSDEAMQVLLRALELRPTDGDLIAFIGDSHMARGELGKAREFIDRAKGLCQPGMWLRYAANLERQEGNLPRCRDLWKQVLELEPLAMDAHRSVALALAECDNREAAIAHLQAACDQYPHHFHLAQLLYEWMRESAAPEREAALRRLIEIHPADSWARREYALHLADEQRFDEAFAQMDVSWEVDPKNPSQWTTRAYLHARKGNMAQSREDCKQAIRLSVDLEVAQQDLLSTCDTYEERREALAFIETELERQVTFGQGLLYFRELALGTLEADELLAVLKKGLEARPDLWQSWSAVVRQLTFMERFGEAIEVTLRAVERFPHLPALWVDLADAYRGARNTKGEINALEHALAISPGWSIPQRSLAAVHERDGRLKEAREVYEAAIRRGPLIAANHLALAEFLAQHESKEQAIEIARQALQVDPSAETAWIRMLEWSMALKKTEDAIEFARAAAKERPGETRAWLRLAQALSTRPIDPDPLVDRRNIDETLAAYDEVLARNPRLIDAHDRKAQLLADVSRWDDALAACRPAVFGDPPPLAMRRRRAWILARRADVPAAIEEMRAALQIDRNNKWGWTHLADWLQSQGRWQEYLEAAQNLVRIGPSDPVGITFVGEAKLRLGRRDEGLADLRRASEIAPMYQLPGWILFEEHFGANELDDARAVVQRLKKHAPPDEISAREIRLAVRAQDKESALHTLRRLGRTEGENPGPLLNAVQALEGAGWAEDVLPVLRDLAADGRAHPYCAVLLCERTDVNAPDFYERLKFLDRATARLGSKLRPLDLKAELLSRAGKHDEALAACNSPASPDAELPLRGRAIWIRFQRGEYDRALREMQTLLETNASYWWGWTQLALWAEYLGRNDIHREAAERLIELTPADAFGYVERGRAANARGETAFARQAFVASLERNPTNVQLALETLPMLAAAAEYEPMERVLDLIGPYAAPEQLQPFRTIVEHQRLPFLSRLGRMLTFGAPKVGNCPPGDLIAVGVMLLAAVGILVRLFR